MHLKVDCSDFGPVYFYTLHFSWGRESPFLPLVSINVLRGLGTGLAVPVIQIISRPKPFPLFDTHNHDLFSAGKCSMNIFLSAILCPAIFRRVFFRRVVFRRAFFRTDFFRLKFCTFLPPFIVFI